MQPLENKLFLLFALMLGFFTLSIKADPLREYTSQKNVYITEWSKLKHRAEQGDPEALFVLGNFYFDPPKGSGYRKNHKKAAEYYFEASLRNYPAAQYNVALMLHQGVGFQKDVIESYAWFYLASVNPSPVAKHINSKTAVIVAQLTEEMTVAELSDAQAKVENYLNIIKSKRYRDVKLPALLDN